MFRIIGETFGQFRRPAVDRLSNNRAGRNRLAAHDGALNGINVNGLVERLTDSFILERINFIFTGNRDKKRLIGKLIQRDQHHAVFRAGPDRNIAVALKSGNVLCGRIDDEVNLTG